MKTKIIITIFCAILLSAIAISCVEARSTETRQQMTNRHRLEVQRLMQRHRHEKQLFERSLARGPYPEELYQWGGRRPTPRQLRTWKREQRQHLFNEQSYRFDNLRRKHRNERQQLRRR